MKAPLLLCACVLGLGLAAQPDFDRNYCGFADNDSLDLTNDGIPDVVVQGFRSGTDDEPSSSGTCMLYVVNLPGTTLLNTRDAQGYWRTKVCTPGERIPAADTTVQDDLRIPTIHYTDGSIRVAYWGYGGNTELFTVTPGLGTQHYVFHTKGKGQAWHGSFRIDPPMGMDQVRIHVGNLLPIDQPFVIR